MSAERIGFLHIPKTGGRSINTLLQHYLKREIRIVSIYDFVNFGDFISKFSILSGHVPAFVFEGEPIPRRLFTLLRDPVERVISNYRFIVSMEEHYAHDYVRAKGLSLTDCFEHPVLRIEIVNFQTKMLGWTPDAPLRWPVGDRAGADGFSQAYNGFQYGAADRTTLGAALNRLTSMDFAFIDDAQSITDMCRDGLGFTPGLVPHENRNEAGPYELTDAELDIIREHNLLDLALIDFARERIRRKKIQLDEVEAI